MRKNKDIAGLLGFSVGLWGVHQFYLGNFVKGIMHLFMFYYIGWKISLFFAIISAMKLLFMSEESFDMKYNYGILGKKKIDDSSYKRMIPKQTKNPNYRNTFQNQSMNTAQKEYIALQKSALQKFNDFDFEGSISDYHKILQLNDQEINTYFQLACCYSASEHKELGFYYLSKAVEKGLKDYNIIKNNDALAFLRIQPEFVIFEQNGYRLIEIDTNTEEKIKEFRAGLIDEDALMVSTKNNLV